MDAVRELIVANNVRFMAAFKRGDAAGIAAMYTQDGKLLPPNGPIVAGRKRVQAFWHEAKQAGGQETKLETLEVESRGDLAIEIGRYTLTIQPATGGTVTDKGKYLVVWKNDQGSWKLHVDIWNSDAPT